MHDFTNGCICKSTYALDPKCPVKGGWSGTRAVAYSPDGNSFVLGGGDGMVQICDAETGAKVGGHGGSMLEGAR